MSKVRMVQLGRRNPSSTLIRDSSSTGPRQAASVLSAALRLIHYPESSAACIRRPFSFWVHSQHRMWLVYWAQTDRVGGVASIATTSTSSGAS